MSKSKGIDVSIELSQFATITINTDGSGSIDSYLLEDRPDDWESDPFHVAIDCLLGLALYHAMAGVDVKSDEYEAGFNQVIIDITNKFSDE